MHTMGGGWYDSPPERMSRSVCSKQSIGRAAAEIVGRRLLTSVFMLAKQYAGFQNTRLPFRCMVYMPTPPSVHGVWEASFRCTCVAADLG